MTKKLRIQAEALSTRKKAKELMKKAESQGYSKIDFSNVEFVSRSFTHEIITQSDIRDVEIIGLNERVQKMFDVVKKTVSAKA